VYGVVSRGKAGIFEDGMQSNGMECEYASHKNKRYGDEALRMEDATPRLESCWGRIGSNLASELHN
jgi:hypothetical protein